MKNLDESEIFSKLIEIYLQAEQEWPLPSESSEEAFYNLGFYKGKIRALEEVFQEITRDEPGQSDTER